MKIKKEDVIIIDDTMHFRSMRAQCWKLARTYGYGYCQIYTACGSDICLERNRDRNEVAKVPDHVLNRMIEIFEPPDRGGGRCPWDGFTVTIDTSLFPENGSKALLEQVLEMWKAPAPCLKDEKQLDPLIRKLTVESFVHQVDLQSRQIIHRALAAIPASSLAEMKSDAARRMNEARKTCLIKARKGETEIEVEEFLAPFDEFCKSVLAEIFSMLGQSFPQKDVSDV